MIAQTYSWTDPQSGWTCPINSSVRSIATAGHMQTGLNFLMYCLGISINPLGRIQPKTFERPNLYFIVFEVNSNGTFDLTVENTLWVTIKHLDRSN